MNKFVLDGNITTEVVLKNTTNGKTYLSLGVAHNNKYTNKMGQEITQTTFVYVTFWGEQAEALSTEATKGQGIVLEGSLATESYNDANTGKQLYKLVLRPFRYVLGPKSISKPKPKTYEPTEPEEQQSQVETVTQEEIDDIPF